MAVEHRQWSAPLMWFSGGSSGLSFCTNAALLLLFETSDSLSACVLQVLLCLFAFFVLLLVIYVCLCPPHRCLVTVLNCDHIVFPSYLLVPLLPITNLNTILLLSILQGLSNPIVLCACTGAASLRLCGASTKLPLCGFLQFLWLGGAAISGPSDA